MLVFGSICGDSYAKYIKGKKFLSYQVIPLQIDMDTTRDSDKVIISFD